MTSLVDAISKKYEKLKDYHIFGGCIRNSCGGSGVNILFPAHTLTMDCQNISSVGSESELQKTASHVRELDLSGNKLSSWKEIFRLLRCLTSVESLNLSQNPLGSQESDKPYCQKMNASNPVNHSDISGTNRHNNERTSLRSLSYLKANISSCVEDFNKKTVRQYVENSKLISQLLKSKQSTINTLQKNHSDTLCFNSNNARTPSQMALECGIIVPGTMFTRLTVLVLNSTYIPWNWLTDLLRRLPNLTNLHIALNNYGADQHLIAGSISGNDDDDDEYDSLFIDPIPTFAHVHNLYCSDNGISDWSLVCHLVRHFPSLEHLVLLGNPIVNIPKPLVSAATATSVTSGRRSSVEQPPISANNDSNSIGQTCANQNQHLFANLHTLSLSETMIDQWTSIDALCDWMPNLTNLRLGNNLPLFQSLPEPSCRAQVIARLPNLCTYNRSAIDSEEREKAERDFVRHYGQQEPIDRPNRYWELEHQHGHLEPLADIDLSPKRFIRVRISMEGKEIWHDLNVSLKVAQAKRQFCHLFGIKSPNEIKRFKLFYFDQIISEVNGPEELKFPTRALHSYQPEPGDLFELIELPKYAKH